MSSNRKWIIAFLLGILTGFVIYEFFPPRRIAVEREAQEEFGRLAEIATEISKYYVDEVDPEALFDGAVEGMLKKLDPHTVYIPSKEMEDIAERFQGQFEGIGVEFIVQEHYPTVVSPIQGSPSDLLGIRAGDKIVAVENESTFDMSSDDVALRLKGPRGSRVNVAIQRIGEADSLYFTIQRDKIPIRSVLTSFMYDDTTGFIKLTRFSRTTEEEVSEALKKLKEKGMNRLVLDLRNNSGGYLDQAVAVTNKFVPEGRKIVSTEGRIPQANEAYFADDDPEKTNAPLIVLINNGSASASEIVAGAVQDTDRGLIVGERSFGKGLVQNQFGLNDGSAVRVTVAKYLTPSGRPIQRPFSASKREYYESAFAEDREAAAQNDSTRLKYFTEGGRAVFGGGGIAPDIQLVWENRASPLIYELLRRNLFFKIGADFAANHRELADDNARFMTEFETPDAVVEELKQKAEDASIIFSPSEWRKNRTVIKKRLKSEIARNLWNSAAYYETQIREDLKIRSAAREFSLAPIKEESR